MGFDQFDYRVRSPRALEGCQELPGHAAISYTAWRAKDSLPRLHLIWPDLDSPVGEPQSLGKPIQEWQDHLLGILALHEQPDGLEDEIRQEVQRLEGSPEPVKRRILAALRVNLRVAQGWLEHEKRVLKWLETFKQMDGYPFRDPCGAQYFTSPLEGSQTTTDVVVC